MKGMRTIQASAMLAVLLLSLVPLAGAEEKSVIDQSNWQEIEELLPEHALDWVKRGDVIVNVGTLNYEPRTCWPSWARESLQENVGKYDINEEMEIVDAKTRERPRFVKGFPFPKIDMNDPKAAVKVMYNGYYVRDVNGPFIVDDVKFRFLGRNTGYERDVTIKAYMYPFDGYGPAVEYKNPDDFETQLQIIATDPYDMAGTSMMTWRYRSAKQDMLYGYVPAVRRVRRMTPANRSDAMFGSDFSRDDGGYPCYDGKIPDFEWKLIGKKDVLVAYIAKDPLGFRTNSRGEWVVDTRGKKIVSYGYEEKDWKGAPWTNTCAVWVKRPAWVIEMRSKDRYYNYGKQIVYLDAETFNGLWKEIWDRSDEYWKTLQNSWGNALSADGTYGTNLAATFLIVDEKAQHATIVDYVGSDYKWTQEAKIDESQFSLGGFTKLCK